MNAKPVWLMCLLALGACGEVRSEAGGNNAAASKAVTPRPGKYRVEFVREIMACASRNTIARNWNRLRHEH